MLFLTSLLVERNGGLYINSYLKQGDLVRISDLQGTGGSDFVLIVISSLVLFLLISITALINTLDQMKVTLYVFYFLISMFILNLTETAKFIDINYATLFLAKNPLYIIWFTVYLVIFTLIIYEVIRAFTSNRANNHCPSK